MSVSLSGCHVSQTAEPSYSIIINGIKFVFEIDGLESMIMSVVMF